jgi:type VI secretion system protein ImpL
VFGSIRSFLGSFINRITLGILLLLVLSLLVWFVGPLFAVSFSGAQVQPLGPEWMRWVVIATLWGIWLLRQLIRWWRERNLNGRLFSQLAKMQQGQAQPGQPAGAEEVAELNRRFKEASEVLKKLRFSTPGKGGLMSGLSRQYVYQLPWYAFIGAPGSGKTTALVNAGLTFPLAEQFGKAAIRGVGGTRNCDWWFTNEAVLIDTAGRYTTQESNESVDKAEWKGFLALLKRFRPRQPLNGVLLTLSVSDLLQMSAQEREVHAATLKARLAELREGLGVQFPVYVLVTKVDLLSGFLEYFLNLDREQRAQVWGFTLPYDPDQHSLGAVRESFNAEFDLLYQRLNAGMHERLLNEPDLSRRALAYALPQQLAGLRDVLGRLLAGVFSESKFNEQSLLRGVYFTSGTQEGTPFDRVLGAMQRSFQVAAKVPGTEVSAATGKSYFLQDLLQKVIFPEHFIAGRNRSAERRLQVLRWVGLGALGLLFVAANVAWSPWVSYGNNKRYIEEVAGQAQALAAAVQALPTAPSDAAPALLPLLNQARNVSQSASFDFARPPWSYLWGLFQGGKLDAGARVAYARLLDEAFLPRIASRVENLLRNAPPGNADYLYQALKAYLMLNGAGHFDAEALKLWIRADWDRNHVTATLQERQQLDVHLDALMADRVLESPFPINQELVKSAREQLNQQPPANRSYSRIKARLLGPDLPEFSIASVAGAEAPNVLTRASKQPLNAGLPGLYTPRGYQQFQKELAVAMADLSQEDAWVLGRASPAKAAVPNPADLLQQTQQIKRIYLTEYAKVWLDYLGDVRLIARNSLAETLQVTRLLAAPDSPLLLLARAASRETTLLADTANSNSSSVGQAMDKLNRLKQEVSSAAGMALGTAGAGDEKVEMIVEGPFASLHAMTKGAPGAAPIDGLSKVLEDYLASLMAAESALRGGMVPRTQDAENRLRLEAERMPQPVRGVIEALVGQAAQQVAGGTRSSASASIKGGVGQTCAALISGRYPFVRSAKQDVQINDFAQVFAPGGLMDDVFQKNLAAFVDTSKTTWAPRPGPEGAGAGSAADVAQFQRAAIIRDAFFAPGSRSLKFDLIVRLLPLAGADKVELDVDGQPVAASGGAEGSGRVSWPGVRGTNQVKLTVTTKAGVQTIGSDGAWALHRLIDKGQVQPGGSPERLLVQFTVDGKPVGVEFSAQSVRNPLRLPQMEGFACPGKV